MRKKTEHLAKPAFKLTIKAKLVGFSLIMLLFLIGTSLFLRNFIVEGSEAREYQVKLQTIVEQTTAVSKNFGDLKYWLTDLEVSWLNESEENADAAQEQLLQNLAPLEKLYPDEVAQIRSHAQTFVDNSLEAVDAYVDDNRVLGNSLASKARENTVSVDLVMASIFKDANDKAQVSRDTARAQEESALVTSVIVVIAAVIIISLITFFIIRSITQPLSRMTDVMADLANEEFWVEIPALGREDEIGKIAKALQVFRDAGLQNNLLRIDAEKNLFYKENEEEANKEKARSERDAKRNREKQEQKQAATAERDDRSKRVSAMIAKFESKVNAGIATLMTETGSMKSSVGLMVDTAHNASKLTTTVTTASEQTSRNVQTVAAATEELSVSIGEIDMQLKQANSISQDAVKEARRSTQQVSELAKMAKKISDIIDLISDIASQTNLLALNATIEAARAGDAGKGFAVVASEVKSLAAQTAQATEDIGTQIYSMQSATDESVSAIENIDKVIRQISDITQGISSAVEEQNTATAEISHSVQQASVGTAEASSNITQVSISAEETINAAQKVLIGINELDKVADTFGNDIQDFLNQVREA